MLGVPMLAYSYWRYLSAKKTIDDRALNRHVLEHLRLELTRFESGPVRVLEVGAGLGTMIARLAELRLVRHADYLAVDVDADILARAKLWLVEWGRSSGHSVEPLGDGLRIRGSDFDFRARFVESEISEYLRTDPPDAPADLVIANAFLDLVELPATLARLLSRLSANGLYWFSINYDGETIFLPEHARDEELMLTYDTSMDQRMRGGLSAGDSKTGRHLFQHLRRVGASVLAAGASDWVVHARDSVYEADEAYFLHHIVHTVDDELKQHPAVSAGDLAEWVATRHAQIEQGELVYIAHQLDFVGRPSGPGSRSEP